MNFYGNTYELQINGFQRVYKINNKINSNSIQQKRKNTALFASNLSIRNQFLKGGILFESHKYYFDNKHMIGSRKKDKTNEKQEEVKVQVESQLRRSTRVVKAKSDDDFLIGHDQLDLYIGKDPSQDAYGTKRPRKSYCYDDLSDFSDNHRPSKKKYRSSQNMRRCLPLNAVQGLLKWRQEIVNIPIPQPTKDNSQLIKVKNICKESLDKYAQGIQALFINIDWNKKNKKIDELKNLKIQSLKLMSRGLLFIWTPKDLMTQIIQLMEQKGFSYVENLQIAHLDRQTAYQIYQKKNGIVEKKLEEPTNVRETKKKQGKKAEKQLETEQDHEDFPFNEVVASLENVDAVQLIHVSSHQYFNVSKKTLFIFRRSSQQKLQLRHQRTCDVVFDMPKNPDGKCQPELKSYLFTMIETMLPKCLQYNDNLKMMELWGDGLARRRGWVTIVQQ